MEEEKGWRNGGGSGGNDGGGGAGVVVGSQVAVSTFWCPAILPLSRTTKQPNRGSPWQSSKKMVKKVLQKIVEINK